VDAYGIVCDELDAYGAGLTEKPQIVALNKIDALDAKSVTKLQKKLAKASGAEVMLLSGASGEGLEAVLDRLIEAIPAPEEVEKDVEGGEWSPI
jgi:GTP-binding protein